MHKKKNRIKQIVFASLIAALYAGLTYGFSFISYGAVQFRISEILTVLPIFTPTGIIGVTVGCFLGNIGNIGANPFDIIFGTLATFIAAVITYLCRNIKIKGIPLISLLSPIVINSLIIGLELTVVFVNQKGGFPIFALWVALGEAVVCLGLGIPFYIILNKHKQIFTDC